MSITDSCIGWETTERMLRWGYDALEKIIRCKSLSENWEECCFRGKGWLARRDEGEYPLWVFD